MSVITVNLCPESLAKLPRLGRSAYVRAAILAYGGASPPPPPLKSEGKPVFVRDGRRYNPPLKPGLPNWREGDRVVYAPCIEAPHIDGRQAWLWQQYFEAWKWPDPFPGLVEWHSMGCPEKPLEAHRLPVELRGGVVPAAAVEPEAVEPEAVEPEAVEPEAVEPESQAVPPPAVQLATGVLCATLPDDI